MSSILDFTSLRYFPDLRWPTQADQWPALPHLPQALVSHRPDASARPGWDQLVECGQFTGRDTDDTARPGEGWPEAAAADERRAAATFPAAATDVRRDASTAAVAAADGC